MASVNERELIIKLTVAFSIASDHLYYCGYGDAWECECALKNDDPLDKKIEAALSDGTAYIGKEELEKALAPPLKTKKKRA